MSDDFDLLNNFVHDLKTPLSSAKSYVELVEHSGDLNDKQKHFCDRALVGLERIQQIIDELLDFARMEADNTLSTSTCDLRKLVEKAVLLLENMAEDNRVTLEYEVSNEARHVVADARLMRHVFTNLISNGIKYNRAGGTVSVTTQRVGDVVQVTVSDTGIGIPLDAQERIFERFYRVDRNDRRRIEGTGLGLTIVQTIIHRHGGQISVQSEPGEGSVFRFTLPVQGQTGRVDFDREAPDDIDDKHQERRENHENSDSSDMF
jgi:two-component system phosphate regulon sensor histidine kinase PhoR